MIEAKSVIAVLKKHKKKNLENGLDAMLVSSQVVDIIVSLEMKELEKVIKGLEQFKSDLKPFCGNNADWKKVDDAIAMLKEQEAVKPRVSTVEQRCGNCNKVIEMDGWEACPWCGKPILWEAVGRSVKWDD